MKKNIYIEIVRTDVIGLSSMSLRSSKLIYDVLKQHYSHVTVSTISNIQDLEALAAKKTRLSFPGYEASPRYWLP